MDLPEAPIAQEGFYVTHFLTVEEGMRACPLRSSSVTSENSKGSILTAYRQSAFATIQGQLRGCRPIALRRYYRSNQLKTKGMTFVYRSRLRSVF